MAKPFGNTNELLDDIVDFCAEKTSAGNFAKKHGEAMKTFVYRVWKPKMEEVLKAGYKLDSDEAKEELYKKFNTKLSLFCAAFID